jgi:hypothetical protein
MGTDRKTLRLRIKYCGGCNPEIDRGAVADEFVRLLEKTSVEIQFAGDDDPADITLLLNGCARACKEEELEAIPGFSPFLSVQGERLRYRRVPEKEIPTELFGLVQGFLTVENRDPGC